MAVRINLLSWFSVVFCFAFAGTSSAQTSALPAPVIHSTARLVQVSVVVQDKKGNPVTNLGKDDFSIEDESKPQNISVFFGGGPSHAAPATLPPNVFTNRFDLKGEEPGAVTVILFDLLNSSVNDQVYVRQKILTFLKSLRPQDHVAIYGLTNQLILLHEFTRDASALVDAVNHFTPRELAAFDSSNPADFTFPALANDPFWRQFEERVNNANAEIADASMVDRAEMTAAALRAITDHVAAVPGRKSLVWVSGGFPLQIELGYIGVPYREFRSLEIEVKSTAEALNRVNMVIYPIDVRGLLPEGMFDVSNNNLNCMDCVKGNPSFFTRSSLRDSEQMLAAATGGEAFFGNNDIAGALRRAFDDERYSYTLGFYPNHGKWNGKFHEIKVAVKGKNVRLRYRKGYFAVPDRPASDEAAQLALLDAARSPLDATTVGMIVSGKAAPGSRSVELHVGLDPKQLLLAMAKDHRVGAVDLFFVQRDGAANTLAAEKQHVGINLDQAQYESKLNEAVVLGKHLEISPKASELRIIVRDASSGDIGSVTIPTATFFQPGAPVAAQ